MRRRELRAGGVGRERGDRDRRSAMSCTCGSTEPGSVALLNRVRGLDHLYGRFFAETDTLGVVRGRAASRADDDSRGVVRCRCAPTRRRPRRSARFRRAAGRRPADRRSCSPWRRGACRRVTRQLMQLDSIYFTPDGVERDDAEDELGVDRPAGPLDPARPRDRQGEHGHGLALPPRRGGAGSGW